MFNVARAVALAAVLPSILIVPRLFRPAALTLVDELRLPPPPFVPIFTVPVLLRMPAMVTLLPPAALAVSTLSVPETNKASLTASVCPYCRSSSPAK